MPTPKKGARLGGSPAHQKLILSNLATQLFDHGHDILAEGSHGPGPAADARLPMARQIDRHGLVPRRQWAQLPTPVAPVTRPAMDEHQGRRPRAVHLERQGNAIPRSGEPAHRRTTVTTMAPKAWPGTAHAGRPQLRQVGPERGAGDRRATGARPGSGPARCRCQAVAGPCPGWRRRLSTGRWPSSRARRGEQVAGLDGRVAGVDPAVDLPETTPDTWWS